MENKKVDLESYISRIDLWREELKVNREESINIVAFRKSQIRLAQKTIQLQEGSIKLVDAEIRYANKEIVKIRKKINSMEEN